MQWDKGHGPTRARIAVGLSIMLLLTGCWEVHEATPFGDASTMADLGVPPSDGGPDADGGDAGELDGGAVDGGSSDGGSFDGGVPDAGVTCAEGEWDHDRDSATACRAWRVCAPGFSVAVDGSPTVDRECERCVSGFTTLADQAMCIPWSTCGPGSAIGTPGSATANVACAPCVGGFSTGNNAAACTAWRSCAVGHYVTSAGSATADRTCAVCPEGSTSTAPNQTSCSAVGACPLGSQPDGRLGCEACAAGSFCPGNTAAQACTAERWDHDQDPRTPCASWRVCTAGTYVAMAGTATTDRRCETCPTGFTTGTNVAVCATWTRCVEGTQISSEGTSNADRQCASCTSGFTVTENATMCTPWSDCPAGDYVQSAGTPTTDRECEACMPGSTTTSPNQTNCEPCGAGTEPGGGGGCVACSAGTFCPGGSPALACASGEWDDDGDASTPCIPWTVCGAWGSVSEGSATSDRRCFGEPLWQWRQHQMYDLGEVASMRFLDDDLVVANNFIRAHPGPHDRWRGRLARVTPVGPRWYLDQHPLRGTNDTFQMGQLDVDSQGNVFVPVSSSWQVNTPYGPYTSARGEVWSHDVFGVLRWTYVDSNSRFGAVAVADDGSIRGAGTRMRWAGSVEGAHIETIVPTGGPLTPTLFTANEWDAAQSVARTAAGGFVVAGRVGIPEYPGQVPGGNHDVFVGGVASDNQIEWSIQFGTTSSDTVARVLALPDGSCVVVGSTGGSLPGYTNGGGTDGFLAFYDPATDTLDVQQFGGPSSESVQDAAVDSNGTVYVIGSTDVVGYATFLHAYQGPGEPLWVNDIRTIPRFRGTAIAVDDTRIALGGQLMTPYSMYDDGYDAIVYVFARP